MNNRSDKSNPGPHERHGPHPSTDDRGDEEQVRAWVQLHALGVRAHRAREIIASGGPEICLSNGLPGLRPWVTDPQWQRLSTDTAAFGRAMQWSDQVVHFRRAGGHILTPDFAAWRYRGESRNSFPLCMYARGNLAWLHVAPRIGLVGSRRPTARAAARARRYAHLLTSAGAMVCSGGAWGIDLAAHQGAIDAGRGTIAVLGDPLQPKADERPQRLRAWGQQSLSLVPHGPWVPMSRYLFVSRNQWIAALCDALIVFEGAARSGTAHTAKAALRYGVPIYAVPGDPDAPNSETPNRLIAEGAAKPLLRIETLIANLGLSASPKPDRGMDKRPEEDRTVRHCSVYPTPSTACALAQRLEKGESIDLERAARELGKTVPEILQVATMLELEGRIRRVGDSLHPIPAERQGSRWPPTF